VERRSKFGSWDRGANTSVRIARSPGPLGYFIVSRAVSDSSGLSSRVLYYPIGRWYRVRSAIVDRKLGTSSGHMRTKLAKLDMKLTLAFELHHSYLQHFISLIELSSHNIFLPTHLSNLLHPLSCPIPYFIITAT
jgi:hypothetical protein